MEDKYEAHLPNLNENDGDDFQLWLLGVKATLEGRELIDTHSDHSVGLSVDCRARSIIVNSLEDSALSSVQVATNFKKAWE